MGTQETGFGPKLTLEAIRVGDRFGLRILADGHAYILQNETVLAERDLRSVSWIARQGRIGLFASCAKSGAGTALDDFGGGDVP